MLRSTNSSPAGDIPVPQAEVRSLERDLEALVAHGVRVAGLAALSTSARQPLRSVSTSTGFARAQIRDQAVHVGFRPEPEGPRQLFFQIAIHLTLRAGATPNVPLL